MSRTTITLKFEMFLFLDEARYRGWKILIAINLSTLTPNEDNNFGDSLVLVFVQPKNTQKGGGNRLEEVVVTKELYTWSNT